MDDLGVRIRWSQRPGVRGYCDVKTAVGATGCWHAIPGTITNINLCRSEFNLPTVKITITIIHPTYTGRFIKIIMRSINPLNGCNAGNGGGDSNIAATAVR